MIHIYIYIYPGISYCLAKNRNKCNPKQCMARKQITPALHLYVIELQFSEGVGASSRLKSAKEKVQLAKERLEQRKKSLEGENEISAAGAKEEDEEAKKRRELDIVLGLIEASDEAPDSHVAKSILTSRNPVKSKAKKEENNVGREERELTVSNNNKERQVETNGSQIENLKDIQKNDHESNTSEEETDLLKEIPTYLFLDTCAVIRMSQGFSNTFTWENLLDRSRKGLFGEGFEKAGDRVTLIITDTVMRELDHLKKRPDLFRNVISLQSDDGYLAQAVHLKFLEMLGAHQVAYCVISEENREVSV